MSRQEVPFLTGNDDGQLANPSLPPVLADGSYNRVDYNAVLLYHENELKQTYRKTHLVPFTENFPYQDLFPRFYQLLVEHDYHFWEKGTEYTVLDAEGVKFSTPICFEDVFGYISRRFVREGAQVIVNMTNDSWSGSVAAQMQHMAMAVFRAVENRRSVIRGSNSGMTCTIDPDGRIIDMMEPFTRGYMISTVPIYTERTTPYTMWGNWFAVSALIAAAGLLLVGLGIRVFRSKDD
jgi:apolipoprotein N-acyltransferase